MKLIAFLKQPPTQGFNLHQLAELGVSLGLDGYDLSFRPGFPVHPENVRTALPEAVKIFRQHNLSVGMLTGPGDFLKASDPTSEATLAAMAETGVPLVKLGYWKQEPASEKYWQRVEQIRAELDRWQKLAAKHSVKVCVHTHVGMIARNAATLMHLLRGLDPRYVGAYIDPAHLLVEGEPFDVACAIVDEYLCIVGVKDAVLERKVENGHGKTVAHFRVNAARGWVDWTNVFATLARIRYAGPISVHGLMDPQSYADGKDWRAELKREVDFFRNFVSQTKGI